MCFKVGKEGTEDGESAEMSLHEPCQSGAGTSQQDDLAQATITQQKVAEVDILLSLHAIKILRDLGLQVEFRLARPGLMKDFAGTWRVQPFKQLALSEAPHSQAQSNNPWHSLSNTLSSCTHCSGSPYKLTSSCVCMPSIVQQTSIVVPLELSAPEQQKFST